MESLNEVKLNNIHCSSLIHQVCHFIVDNY